MIPGKTKTHDPKLIFRGPNSDQKSVIFRYFGRFIGGVKNFLFKSLRVVIELSMSYYFKSLPQKFQPQIRSIMAFLVNKMK